MIEFYAFTLGETESDCVMHKLPARWQSHASDLDPRKTDLYHTCYQDCHLYPSDWTIDEGRGYIPQNRVIYSNDSVSHQACMYTALVPVEGYPSECLHSVSVENWVYRISGASAPCGVSVEMTPTSLLIEGPFNYPSDYWEGGRFYRRYRAELRFDTVWYRDELYHFGQQDPYYVDEGYKTYQVVTGEYRTSTADDIRNFYRQPENFIFSYAPESLPDEDIQTRLLRSCFTQMDYMRVGVLENLASLEIPGTELVESIHNALRHGIKDKAKLFSDLYLFKKFTGDTTTADLKKIRDGFRQVRTLIFSRSVRVHSTFTHGGVQYSCTLWANPFASGTYIRRMLGYTIRPSEVWACLPFSFMVDWVLHTDEELQNVEDAYDFRRNIWHVTLICWTAKSTIQVPINTPSGWPLALARVKRFSRNHTDTLPAYRYQRPDYGLGINLDHFMEFGTILFNNLKK